MVYSIVCPFYNSAMANVIKSQINRVIAFKHLAAKPHLVLCYQQQKQPVKELVYMRTFRHFLIFIQDDSAATAIEYGLIAAGISVAIITVVASLGSSLNTTFTSVATALK